MAALWASGTNVSETTGPPVVALASGVSMLPGESRESTSHEFRLQFQVQGNLVLLRLPDEEVLFATPTEDLGAVRMTMQTNGNLEILDADDVVLWESETSGNPSAYLVLQNDGNLVIYEAEGIQPLAVWSIRPDFAGGSIETLDWMTSVTESPLAVEQRMGLRVSPRQMFEYSYVTVGAVRTYFDFLTMQAGGSPAYVPLWHDVGRLTAPAEAGQTVVNVDTRWTEFQNCRFAIFVKDERSNPFDYELVEIDSFTDSTLTLGQGLTNGWPRGNRIYPVKKCKVETQPQAERIADRAFRARVRFQSLEANKSNAVPNILGEFLGNYVIEADPNRVDLTANYDRKWFALDNQFGIPQQYDVSGFVRQNFQWFAKGREAHWRLRGLFYTLQGRRLPVWLSSGMMDLEITEFLGDADTSLRVKRCGYTDMGGPINHREFIVIHLYDGTRLYRRIEAAAIVGDGSTEQLILDEGPGRAIYPEDVKRISFIDFCRLDQDSVELIHHADTKGLTTANSVFLTDPGIGGVENFLEIEVTPPPPETPPPLLTVIDPFRNPQGKVWLYVPSFGTFAGSDYVGVWWASRRSDEELINNDNPRLPPDVGDAFPPPSISGSGAYITLPDTGSFLVRVGLFFLNTFGGPSATIDARIVFINSELEPVGFGGLYNPNMRYQAQSGRDQVYYAKTDPEVPLQVHVEFKFTGAGNMFPRCNALQDCEPYHGKAGAVAGDSYFIVEWWPD